MKIHGQKINIRLSFSLSVEEASRLWIYDQNIDNIQENPSRLSLIFNSAKHATKKEINESIIRSIKNSGTEAPGIYISYFGGKDMEKIIKSITQIFKNKLLLGE